MAAVAQRPEEATEVRGAGGEPDGEARRPACSGGRTVPLDKAG